MTVLMKLGIVVITLWCIISLDSGIVSGARQRVEKSNEDDEQKIISSVLFTSTSDKQETMTMAAVAKELKKQRPNIKILFVTYKEHESDILKFISPTELRLFTHSDECIAKEARMNISDAFKLSWDEGVSTFYGTRALSYTDEVNVIGNAFLSFTPSLMVIDYLATSAIDYATHVNASYVVYYPNTALGGMNIESSWAVPSSLKKVSSLGDMSLSQRIQQVLESFSLTMARSDTNHLLNEKRRALGFIEYQDPVTNIQHHPVLVHSILGFEYSRPLSPLIKMVGMHVSGESAEVLATPANEAEKKLAEWCDYRVQEEERPIVVVKFEGFDLLDEEPLKRLINAVVASRGRVLILVPKQYLHLKGIRLESLLDGLVVHTGNDTATATATVHSLIRIESSPNISSDLFVLNQPLVRVFVHTGYSSQVASGIYAGKPMLVVSGYSDMGMQAANTARLVDLGIAITLHRDDDFTTAHVQEALAALLDSDVALDLRQRMGWLQRINERQGAGVEGSVQVINEILAVGSQHLVPLSARVGMYTIESSGMDAIILVALGGILCILLQCVAACKFSHWFSKKMQSSKGKIE